MKIFLVIVVLLILRDILAWLFHWNEGETFIDLFENAKHNRAIDKEWEKNGRPIVGTTIGWRRDPWNKEDGYKDDGFNKKYFGDGHSYSRLIRGGTKEYREKFEKDVKESSK